MLSEQQQRIMGYFIEEAKDHLNTIEQGLLNLQSTISDPEMAHEVFRAAHSVKGGAAMLGLDSIQHTSHRLEDYFKVLKECPVQVDQRLESLLLNVFDTLRDLLDQLQGPFGLTDDKAQEAMGAIEPTFTQLNEHISQLVSKAGVTPPDDVDLQTGPQMPKPVVAPVVAAAPEPAEESAFQLIFQSDVPARLRDMLQLFKQPDMPETRQQLDGICQSLAQAGEQFELLPWVDLLNLTRRAIAHPDNEFRALAPVVIREIKHAQEQTLAGQSMAISAGDALLALVPPEPELDFDDLESLDFLADEVEEVGSFELPELGFGMDDIDLVDEAEADFLGLGEESDGDLDFGQLSPGEAGTLVQENSFAELDLMGQFGTDDLASLASEDGPSVGAAELNSLADLFEADTPDLGMTWQEEEILSDVDAGMPEPLEMDMSGDFSDLLQAGLEGQTDASMENGFPFSREDGVEEDSLSDLVRRAEAASSSLPDLDAVADDDFLAELSSMDAPDAAFDVLGDRTSPENQEMMGELNLFFSDIQDDSLEDANVLSLGSLEDEESADFLFEDASEPVIITDLPEMDDPFGGISISSFALDEDEEPIRSAVDNPFASFESIDGESTDSIEVPPASDAELIDSGAADELTDSPFSFMDFDLEAVAASDATAEDDLFSATISPLDAAADSTPEEAPHAASPEEDEAPTSWLDMLDSDEGLENIPAAPPMWSMDDDDVTADLWDDPMAAGATTSEGAFSLLDIGDGMAAPIATVDADIDEDIEELQEDTVLSTESSDLSEMGFELELPVDLSDDSLADLDLDLDSLMDAATTTEVSAAGDAENLPLDLDFDLDAAMAIAPDQPDASADASEHESLDLFGNDSGVSENEPLDLFGNDSDASETEPLDLFGDNSGTSENEPLDLFGDDSGVSENESLDLFGDDSGTSENEPLDLFGDNSGTSETEPLDLFGDDSVSELPFDLTAEVPDSSAELEFNLDEDSDGFSDLTVNDASGDLDSLLGDAALNFDLELPTDNFLEVAIELSEEVTEQGFDASSLDFDLDFGAEAQPVDAGNDASGGLDDVLGGAGLLDLDLNFEEMSLESASSSTDVGFDSLLDESELGLDLDFDQPLEESLNAGVEPFEPPSHGLADAEEASSSMEFDSLLDESDLMLDLEVSDASETANDEETDLDLDNLLDEGDTDLDLNNLLDESDTDLDLNNLLDEGDTDLNFNNLLDESDTGFDLTFETPSETHNFLDLDLNSFEAAAANEVTDSAFAELSFEEDFTTDASPTLFPNDEATTDADIAGLDLDVDTFLSETGLDLGEEAGGSVTGAALEDDFGDLDALLDDASAPQDAMTADSTVDGDDGFADLEALLGDASDGGVAQLSADGDDFADLEALLDDGPSMSATVSPHDAEPISGIPDDEFKDLEELLEAADNTLGGPPSTRGVRSPAIANRRPAAARTSGMRGDQTMRVSVKNLDNLNNLIGELVVNRNSLEQAEERLRQFLDNLQYQVQQLSDVGQRMRDLYERSLLESSLMSSRKSYQMVGVPTTNPAAAAGASHATGVSFDALEMDRFTGFHTLSQEMIELIVRVRESASDIDFVVGETDQVTRNFRQITSQLQESLTRARMVPFAQTADRLPRAVRDISLRCGKQAELTIEGRDTLIDKMILEQLYDPMTHLVNNAITHGIETPDERTSQGKAPTGRITVRAFHQGNQTVIAVSDDGAGIDPDRVKQKAVERKLVTPEQARLMNRLDVYDLLFHHGFSTRDRADDFAGRGVGMDVVRTSLNEIRGVINIDSTVGRGTTFTIRLPLTLSVSKALCCISNRARIAFPMDGVEDMLDVPRDQIQTNAEGQACIQWRDQLLPFQSLSDLLKFNRSLGRGSVYGGNQEEDIVSVVVLRSNAGSYLALQVDQVLGEQEIVIKQLEGPVPKPVGIAGATVLGDGRIMPIADVLELIDLSMGRIRREAGTSFWDAGADQVPVEPVSEIKTEPTVLIVDDSITVRELLSMTFNKVGYRVEQARDGQEAWEKLRSGLPCELVFCDIEMPRMDGLELLSRLQKDPHLNRIPIAMLTSRGADRHRQMAIQLGAKGYFTKPYLEEVLLDAAQRMLKGEVLVEGSSDDNG